MVRAILSATFVSTWLVKTQLDRLNLALAEGFTNAVRHAHHALPQKQPLKLTLICGSID